VITVSLFLKIKNRVPTSAATSKKLKCENYSINEQSEGTTTGTKNKTFFDRMSLPSTFNNISTLSEFYNYNPLSPINGFDVWHDAIPCRDEMSTKTVNYLYPFFHGLFPLEKPKTTNALTL